MRCLARNKQPFYYALFVEKRPFAITDEFGNTTQTGEWQTVYTNPIQAKANISAARGETETRQFGDDLSYDKELVIDDPDFSIDEFSVLWIEKEPELSESGHTATPHDYIVKKAARSLNFVRYAISRVDITATPALIDSNGNAVFDSAGYAILVRGG